MGILMKTLIKLKRIDDPLVRDFTLDAQKKMVEIAKEVSEDDYDIFSKYVADPLGRWLDKEGYLELLSGVGKYQKSVIDFYNYSAQNIKEICDQMRRYDKRYGQILADYAQQADNVHRLTLALAECLDVNSSEYTPEHPISDRIFWFRTHWVKDINGDQVQISELDSAAEKEYRNELNSINITEEDIVNFCFDEDSIELFEDYTDYIFEEMDWSGLDIVFLATGTVIYKGVEYTVDELLSMLNDEGFEGKMVRKELNKIISSVISGENACQTFMKEHDTAKQDMEALVKNYLEDESKDSKFKSFVENMGGITYVKQLLKSCPELLDYLFTDYKKGLQIIEDIEKTCGQYDCKEMYVAITRLKKDYNNKWIGLLQKSQDFNVDMITELSKKGIEEWIKDEIGDTSVLMTVLDIADTEAKVNGAHQLIAQRKIVDELQVAYENAIKKIKSDNYTEEDLNYAKNMFDMLKETTKSVYATYRGMCNGNPNKQIWCNEQIEKLERIQMNGYNSSYLFTK